MEQLNYDLLFRWFVGLSLDDGVWNASTFSKNRERLLALDIVRRLLGRSVARSTAGQLLSDERFTVDEMLLEGCESHKAYRPVRSCAQEQFLHGIRWKLIHAAAFRSFV
jgi:transposase